MKLYKFKTIIGDGLHYSLDMIVNQRLYLATCNQMNDPEEGAWKINLDPSMKARQEYLEKAERLRGILDATRFTSFTENYDNALLWAHYAGGFTGVAIEYDLDPDIYDIRPMCYCDDSEISLDQVDQVITAQKKPQDIGLLLNKSSCWKYEKEHRLFSDNMYIDALPNRVVFGVKNLKSTDVFRQIVRKYGITISYLQKNKNTYSFYDVTNYESLDN